MPLNIRNENVNRLAHHLATLAGISKTEAVRTALQNEIARREDRAPLRERIRPIVERIAAAPATGLEPTRRFTTNSAATSDVRRCFGARRDPDERT